MSRDTQAWYPNVSSELNGPLSGSTPSRLTRSRGLSQSTGERLLRDSRYGFDSSRKLSSFNVEPSNIDYMRVTMQTRVAVRDKTPHRFQVVPLRDASNLAASRTGASTYLAVPTAQKSHLLHPSSGAPRPYSQARTPPTCPSVRSLDRAGKENHHTNALEATVDHKGASYDAKLLIKSDDLFLSLSAGSALSGSKRKVLSEMNFNNGNISTDFDVNRLSLKKTLGKFATIHNTPSQDIIDAAYPLPYTGSYSQSTSSQSYEEEIHEKSVSGETFEAAGVPQDYSATSQLLLSTRRDSVMSTSTVTQCGNESSSTIAEIRELSPKMKRRHAIYRETLHLPHMGDFGISQRNQDNGLENEDCRSSLSFGCSDMRGYQKKHVTFKLDGEGYSNWVDSSRDSEESIVKLVLDGPFEALYTTKPPRRPSSSDAVHPVRALRHPKHPSLIIESGAQKIIYPDIILELFGDIDFAIKDWTCI